MKLLPTFILIAVLSFSGVYAQSDTYRNAVGARVSLGSGVTTELSYRRTTFATDRFQLDIGYTERGNDDAHTVDSYDLIATYQFTFNVADPIYLFVGPGLGGGLLDIDRENTDIIDKEMYFKGAAIAGVDLDFDFPVIISLSIRPEYNFYGEQDGADVFDDDKFLLNYGLSVRYQF